MTQGASTNPNFGLQLWRNEPYAPDPSCACRSRVWKVPRDPALGTPDAWYMEGHFSQRVYVVPSLGLVVVRFGEDRLDWDEAKMMNGLIGALKPAPSVSLNVAVPDHGFGERAAPRPPDYERPDNWARYPDDEEALAAELAAGFYIHPTTWPGSEWNATVTGTPRRVPPWMPWWLRRRACWMPAAPFMPRAIARLLQPRCSISAATGDRAYGLAFTDIVRAFTHFAGAHRRPPHRDAGPQSGRAATPSVLLTDVIAGDDSLRKTHGRHLHRRHPGSAGLLRGQAQELRAMPQE